MGSGSPLLSFLLLMVSRQMMVLPFASGALTRRGTDEIQWQRVAK
jgi:hypothetical protein